MATLATALPSLASSASGADYALALSYTTMRELVKPYSTFEERDAAASSILSALATSSKQARMVGDQLIIMLERPSKATLTSVDQARMSLL